MRRRTRGLTLLYAGLTDHRIDYFDTMPALITVLFYWGYSIFFHSATSSNISSHSLRLNMLGGFLFTYYNFKFVRFWFDGTKTIYVSYLCLLSSNTCLTCIGQNLAKTNLLIATSLGSTAVLLTPMLERGLVLVKFPSNTRRLLGLFSTATCMSDNMTRFNRRVFLSSRGVSTIKASFNRHRGFRPIVRGVAKNPVDHPHGGRTKSIRFPRTPWGTATKLK